MHERRYIVLYCCISKNTFHQDKSDSIVNQIIFSQSGAGQYGYERTQFFIDGCVKIALNQQTLILSN